MHTTIAESIHAASNSSPSLITFPHFGRHSTKDKPRGIHPEPGFFQIRTQLPLPWVIIPSVPSCSTRSTELPGCASVTHSGRRLCTHHVWTWPLALPEDDTNYNVMLSRQFYGTHYQNLLVLNRLALWHQGTPIKTSLVANIRAEH